MKNIYLIWIAILLGHSIYGQEGFYDKTLTSKKDNISYLISLPTHYEEDANKKHPVILFLHGGDGSNTKHHPKKYALESELEFPFIVIAPHSTGGINWISMDFKMLLSEVSRLYRLDENRIYITGYSYGGYGTWSAITKYPKLFAAAAPICGGGNPDKICNAKNVAIKAYHAQDDNVTPYSKSEEMIEALKNCNKNASLKTASSGGHGIWPFIYKDQEIYKWFLKHNK